MLQTRCIWRTLLKYTTKIWYFTFWIIKGITWICYYSTLILPTHTHNLYNNLHKSSQGLLLTMKNNRLILFQLIKIFPNCAIGSKNAADHKTQLLLTAQQPLMYIASIVQPWLANHTTLLLFITFHFDYKSKNDCWQIKLLY